MTDEVNPASTAALVKATGTILNVNDDEVARYITTRILENEGFSVTEAVSGSEALRLALALPALVVLDVNMPDINGVEVCRRLKADPVTMGIPILHLSATQVDRDDRVLGLENGADGYLTQPVEGEVLVATVRALLRLTRAEERVRSAAREWQAVFDAVSDGICLVNNEGDVQQFNRAFTTMVGISGSDILGRSFATVIQQAFSNIPAIAHDDFLSSMAAPIEVHAGPDRWFQLARQPILTDQNAALTGSVYLLTDITQTKEAARRQRAFLRDVLASVTEGKLRLCDSPGDLPAALPETVGEPVALTKKSIRTLRQRVFETANQKGFPIERSQDLETAVGEAAMNAVVHARSAYGTVRHSEGEDGWIQIWVQDRGEGIAVDRIHRATLERGFSSAGTLGHGFWMMLKIVDRIWLLTGPAGTTIVLEQWREVKESVSWLPPGI